MNAESEIKENSEEVKITDSAPVYGRGMPLYVLLPLCALASTFICTGGWRTGLRATLLGGSLLLGVWVIKKICPVDISWWKRVACFALSGIVSGLLAALIIWGLEMLTGSPTLNNNPYNQAAKNLFFVCPLYGFFMLGCFGMAFNLSRMRRFFIILAGAALANTFCLLDMAYGPDLQAYILSVLYNFVRYYIACLGNCAWYMILWIPCAERIFMLSKKKKTAWEWLIIIVIGGFVGYWLFMGIGMMTIGIKVDRFISQNKNTVFKEKLKGVIVFLKDEEYYDCEKRAFFKLPKNKVVCYGLNSNVLRMKDNDNEKNNEIEKLKDGKVIKTIVLPKSYQEVDIVKDTIFYSNDDRLFRLNPPGYDKPEIVLNEFNSNYFAISPDKNFVAYQGGVTGELGRKVICVMNLKSKKILALKRGWFYHSIVVWGKQLEDMLEPKSTKKVTAKK